MPDKDFWERFNDLFANFGDKFDKMKNQSPEEFMGGSPYTKTEEAGVDEEGNSFTKTTYVSKDGKRKFTKKVINARPGKASSSTTSADLQEQLKKAVASQNFELAAKIRDKISELKK